MFYLYNPSVTLRPLWFDGEFGEMLKQIIRSNNDADGLSELARGRLRRKKAELKKSFNCRITEHHRMLIEISLKRKRP